MRCATKERVKLSEVECSRCCCRLLPVRSVSFGSFFCSFGPCLRVFVWFVSLSIYFFTLSIFSLHPISNIGTVMYCRLTMNRLLVTASKASGTCRSSIINYHHPIVAVLNSFNSPAAPTPTLRHCVARRHFADTPSADNETTHTDNNSNSRNDDEIKRGTVKNFNRKNGWGFILPDGHKEEELVFIHRADIAIRDGLGEERYFPK